MRPIDTEKGTLLQLHMNRGEQERTEWEKAEEVSKAIPLEGSLKP